MVELRDILRWLKQRKIRQRRKIAEEALMELHEMSVTIHGRLMLKNACLNPNNGLREEIRVIYWNLLENAPVDQMARWN